MAEVRSSWSWAAPGDIETPYVLPVLLVDRGWGDPVRAMVGNQKM